MVFFCDFITVYLIPFSVICWALWTFHSGGSQEFSILLGEPYGGHPLHMAGGLLVIRGSHRKHPPLMTTTQKTH